MNRIVFMGKPGLSGNYTHFKYMREHCLGLRFFLLSLGDVGPSTIHDEDYINIGDDLDREKQEKELALLFLGFCDDYQIDLIIPMNSSIVAGCLPFLKNAKVIQIINTDTARVYHYVTTSLNYTSKVVCISKRQQEVLKEEFPPNEFEKKTVLIPHGVQHKSYQANPSNHLPLTIGFLGRLHQEHKGIFKLPHILKKISFPYAFELVGEGKDQYRLMRRLKSSKIPFTFRGAVPPDKVDIAIEHWDILLFPSLVEGFPLTLIEAMNNGVVPIANDLPGITDYIIDSGKDGFIVGGNKTKGYVKRIEELNGNRLLLYQMKVTAKETVRRRFELSEIIRQYQKVFQEVFEEPKSKEIKSFSEWQPFVEYKPTISKRLNHNLKLFLRRFF